MCGRDALGLVQRRDSFRGACCHHSQSDHRCSSTLARFRRVTRAPDRVAGRVSRRDCSDDRTTLERFEGRRLDKRRGAGTGRGAGTVGETPLEDKRREPVFLTALIISHSRQFVFIHIHKTAGESMTASLRPDLAANDLVLTTDAQLPLGKHATALEVREHLGADMWDRYFTFSFVRHPIDRALSLYRYVAWHSEQPNRSPLKRLLRRRTPPRDDPQRWPGVKAYRATSSFSEFIRHPLLENAKGMRSQSECLCDEAGDIIVDFVGHFERFNEDFGYVQHRLGLSGRPVLSRNVSKDRKDLHLDLSAEDRSYLAARYHEDFRRFNYEL